MMAAWGAALLAAGSVSSATAGLWVWRQMGPGSARLRRRVIHERVDVSLLGRERTTALARMLPAAAGALLAWLLVSYLTGRGLLALCLSLGVFLLPAWLQEWRETARLLQTAEQLGRAMSMIATSLRRGTPLEAAVAETALSLPSPLGPFLKNMADATLLGVTLAQAVEQLRERPGFRDSTDVQVFATELVICHERGANVVQAFEALQTVLTARRRYRSQVQEQMGQHLVQSLVIAGVGAFVLLAYAAMTERGLDPLLDTAVGQVLLAVAILGNLFLIRMTHLSLLRQVRKV